MNATAKQAVVRMKRTLLTFVALALVTLGIGLVRTPEASAGTNGQQLYYWCTNGIDYGVVKGTNQNGSYVTWEGPARSFAIFTNGWYWVGQVTVYRWIGSQNRWYSQTVNVPKVQSGDTYYATC